MLASIPPSVLLVAVVVIQLVSVRVVIIVARDVVLATTLVARLLAFAILANFFGTTFASSFFTMGCEEANAEQEFL